MKSLLACSAAVIFCIASMIAPAMADEQTAKVSTAIAQSTIDIQRAITISNNSLKGDILSISFDKNDASTSSVYDIKIIASNLKYEITIDADSGEMLDAEQAKLNANDIKEYNTMKQANISLAQAITNAAKIVNGQVVSAEFDLNNGNAIYQIEIITKNKLHKIIVNAMSGKATNNQIVANDD